MLTTKLDRNLVFKLISQDIHIKYHVLRQLRPSETEENIITTTYFYPKREADISQ